MVAAICMIAVSLGGGSSRAELLSPAVGGEKVVAVRAAAAKGDSKESFHGEWAQWLSRVTTQVQAAEDVSSGLSTPKLAKLGGLLRKDLVRKLPIQICCSQWPSAHLLQPGRGNLFEGRRAQSIVHVCMC